MPKSRDDKRPRNPCTECGTRIIDGPTNNGTECMRCMGHDVASFRALWLLANPDEYERRYGQPMRPPPAPEPVQPRTFFLNEQHEV